MPEEVKGMFSNGNSFNRSSNFGSGVTYGIRRPVPGWKFGVSPESRNEDRGDI